MMRNAIVGSDNIDAFVVAAVSTANRVVVVHVNFLNVINASIIVDIIIIIVPPVQIIINTIIDITVFFIILRVTCSHQMWYRAQRCSVIIVINLVER